MKTVASLLLSLTTLVLTAQTKAYTLEECVLMALDKNISIKQSELDIENAEIDKEDAIGSFFTESKCSISAYLEQWFESKHN